MQLVVHVFTTTLLRETACMRDLRIRRCAIDLTASDIINLLICDGHCPLREMKWIDIDVILTVLHEVDLSDWISRIKSSSFFLLL